MKGSRTVLMVLLVVLALPGALYAQETDQAAVMASLHEAINAGDVEAAMALLTDDIVFTATMLDDTSVDTGQDAVRALFEGFVAADFRIQVEILTEEGDTVTTKTLTWGGGMPPGVASLEGRETYVFRDGKIKSITWVATEESNAKVQAAIAAMAAESMPETGGEAFPAYGALLALGGLAVLGGWRLWRRPLSGRGR